MIKYYNINGYIGYGMSTCGKIINHSMQEIIYDKLKHYPQMVKIGNKYIPFYRLLASAFLKNPENKPIVHHKDFNHLNDSIMNLQWVTNKEHRQLHSGCRSKKRNLYNNYIKYLKHKNIKFLCDSISIEFKIKNINYYHHINTMNTSITYKDFNETIYNKKLTILLEEGGGLMKKLICKKCGHRWIPRSDRDPKICPNPKCKSLHWNT